MYICLHKDSVRCHTKSEQHQGTVALDKLRLAAKREDGISQASEIKLFLQKNSVKGAM